MRRGGQLRAVVTFQIDHKRLGSGNDRMNGRKNMDLSNQEITLFWYRKCWEGVLNVIHAFLFGGFSGKYKQLMIILLMGTEVWSGL